MAADISALPKLVEFLNGYGRRMDWPEATMDRIHAATEEILLSVLNADTEEGQSDRRLLLNVREQDEKASLEFVIGSGEENIQHRLSVIESPTSLEDVEEQVSLRLLRHYASSVRHQQYHDVDIVTIQLDLH